MLNYIINHIVRPVHFLSILVKMTGSRQNNCTPFRSAKLTFDGHESFGVFRLALPCWKLHTLASQDHGSWKRFGEGNGIGLPAELYNAGRVKSRLFRNV